MTRLGTKGLTRQVVGRDGQKLTVRVTDRGFFVKPYRARTGEVFVAWSSAYERQLLAEVPEPVRKRPKRVKRGLL